MFGAISEKCREENEQTPAVYPDSVIPSETTNWQGAFVKRFRETKEMKNFEFAAHRVFPMAFLTLHICVCGRSASAVLP